METSLIIPACACAETLPEATGQALAFFRNRGKPFEILIVPNGKDPWLTATTLVAEQLAAKNPEVKVVPHTGAPGKGQALACGFRASQGQWILFTDADLPYELSFFERALKLMPEQAALVVGNRRLPQSRFNIPTTTLRLAYRRHLLGRAFNRVLRAILPIRMTDTQAGIKAMTRQLAELTFERQTNFGFLFDIEIFLTATAHGLKIRDLPVVLYLENEKSTVRIFKEIWACARGLGKIRKRHSEGHYGPKGI